MHTTGLDKSSLKRNRPFFNETKIQVYIFLIIAFVVLNVGLGNWGLTETSEARYAEIGREMYISGDYLNPTLLGIKHYQKPPMTYYFTVLGYDLFGVNEFGARFFLSVSLIAQLWFVFLIAKLLFENEKVAFAASIIYFSFPLALIAARVLTTDSYLLTFVLWSVYLLLQHWKSEKPIYLYGFYAVLGIGFLTKGPAVLIPVGSFFIFWKIFRKEALKISWHTVIGVVLFLLVSSSWFIAVNLENPKFLEYFIDEQLVKRAISAHHLNRAKPFWYYLLFAPLVGFPWLPFIIHNSILNFKESIKNNTISMVLLATVGSIFVFYSIISSKLILYILPLFPFLALLGGNMIFQATNKANQIYYRVYIGINATLFGFLIVGNFLDTIHMNVWTSLGLATLLVLGLVVVHRFIMEGRTRLLSLTMLFSFGLILFLPVVGSQNPQSIHSLKEVVSYVKDIKDNGTSHLMVYNLMLSSTSLYMHDDIVTIVGDPSRVDRDTQFETNSNYKKNLIDSKDPNRKVELRKRLEEKNTVFLMKKTDRLPFWMKETLEQQKHKAEIDTYVFYY